MKFWRRQERKDPVHLAHAFLVDGLTGVGIGEFITDQHSVLVVFIGSHDMDVAGRAR